MQEQEPQPQEQEPQATLMAAPPLRGRSVDHVADGGSLVRPTWRRRAWRWASSGRAAAAGLLLATAGALAWGAQSPRFVVQSVDIAGNQLVDTQTLAQLAAIDGQPIWRVDPAQVAARLREHPYILGAEVSLHLPDRVEIAVREPHQPISWQSGAQRYAIGADGWLSPIASTESLSATAVIDDWRATPAASGSRVPPAVVRLAQMLLVRFPAETGLSLERMAWDPAHGLVLVLADGRALFWGDSTTLDPRLQLVAALERQQVAYRILDLRGRIAAYRTEDDPSLPLQTTTTSSIGRDS